PLLLVRNESGTRSEADSSAHLLGTGSARAEHLANPRRGLPERCSEDSRITGEIGDVEDIERLGEDFNFVTLLKHELFGEPNVGIVFRIAELVVRRQGGD